MLVAPVERLRTGKWEPVNRSPLEFGIVILDGYLTRSVRMERSGCSELLGRGDLLHPWSSPEGDSSLPLEVEWSVLEPARVAYEQMRERLGVGDTPPPGGSFHVAALGEDGKVRIVEVWDSREQAEAWGEKVAAAREEAGFGGRPPSIEYLEVHRIVQR